MKLTTFTKSSPSLQGYSTAPIYNDWNIEDYCKFLYFNLKKWGFEKEDLLNEAGEFLTFLENKDDTIKVLDKDGNQI